jgi:hypothetical protein
VSPKTVRIGDNRAKGYDATDFAEVFARYLANAGGSNRDTVTSHENIGENSHFESVTTPQPVTDQNTHETIKTIGLSRCHASNPPEAENELAEMVLL